MSENTKHQARVTIEGTVDQYLRVAEGAYGTTVLTVSETDIRRPGDENKSFADRTCYIFLNSEQWAELAVAAAEMAKRTEGETQSQHTRHMNDAEVNAWQAANRDAAEIAKGL